MCQLRSPQSITPAGYWPSRLVLTSLVVSNVTVIEAGVGVAVGVGVGVGVAVGVGVNVGVGVGVEVGVRVDAGVAGAAATRKLSKFVYQPFVVVTVTGEHGAVQPVSIVFVSPPARFSCFVG